MANEIISSTEIRLREKTSLQKEMNFRLGRNYSVILMSTRPNPPYRDTVVEDGTVLIYEGHDIPPKYPTIDPKNFDQQERSFTGNLTENGKFHRAAQGFKNGLRAAELVKVYEKLRGGIWSYNGVFELVDSWIEDDGKRRVFKFKLVAIEDIDVNSGKTELHERRRIIPTSVKLEVWKRDGGKCVECGAKDELHFDHILPFSKGGTSIKAENVQLLCARHNLAKSDKII
jgi:hypothetical protein